MRHALSIAIAVSAAGLAAACGPEFTPFNELDKLRVLAVRAEPAELLPGEIATLDALVYEPDGDEISYSWSWCPLTLGAATGYECAVTEEELAAALDEVAPGAAAFVPSFDLGGGATAQIAHLVPPEALAALCEAIASESAPAFVELPECGDELVVTLRLEVSAGGESVTAVKQVALLFDEAAVPNANPEVGALFASPASAGVDPLEDGVELTEDGATILAPSAAHELGVAIDDAASESFVPAGTADDPTPAERRESLFVTWFVTGGETEAMRTGFNDGDASFDLLERNTWTTPSVEESAGEAQIFAVLQDERGGVAWRAARVAVGEE